MFGHFTTLRMKGLTDMAISNNQRTSPYSTGLTIVILLENSIASNKISMDCYEPSFHPCIYNNINNKY